MVGEDDPARERTVEQNLKDTVKWLQDSIDAWRAGRFDEARECLDRAAMSITLAGAVLWKGRK